MSFVYSDVELSHTKEVVEENPLADPSTTIPLDGAYTKAHTLCQIKHKLNLVEELMGAQSGTQGEFGHRGINF